MTRCTPSPRSSTDATLVMPTGHDGRGKRRWGGPFRDRPSVGAGVARYYRVRLEDQQRADVADARRVLRVLTRTHRDVDALVLVGGVSH